MITLRLYQTAAIGELRSQIQAGRKRLLLVSPTGSGKTVVASEIVRSATAKDNRVLFLAHRRELIHQAHARLQEFGIDAGVIRATDLLTAPDKMIQVASVQTLRRRLDRWHPETFAVCIVDEAHHARATTYQAILEHFAGIKTTIGLSATPVRQDGKGLSELFDCLVQTVQPAQLVADGFLVPVKMYSAAAIDLKGVKTSGGDYQLDELSARMNTTRLVGNVVGEWQRLASDRKTVIFATTVEHSRAITERFREAGVAAAHLDGDTPETEREQILGNLREGSVQVVSNCMILTEGWDEPLRVLLHSGAADEVAGFVLANERQSITPGAG